MRSHESRLSHARWTKKQIRFSLDIREGKTLKFRKIKLFDLRKVSPCKVSLV